MRLTHEELVERLKDCAESIIENAESIVGTEKYQSSITVTLYIDSYDELPNISVDRNFAAEKYYERLMEGNNG